MRIRKPNIDELKDYLKEKSIKELIEEYVQQTDNEVAIKDLRAYLIDWIIDYNIHFELYPDKFMVLKS